MTTKILDFEFDLNVFNENQYRLSELIKSMVYSDSESLMELIDSECKNDGIFHEPSLYLHFLGEGKKSSTLEQIVVGYLENLNTDTKFTFNSLADRNSIIYFPRLGHVSAQGVDQSEVVFDKRTKEIEINSRITSITPELELPGSTIRVYSHVPAALLSNLEITLTNSIGNTLSRNNNSINASIQILKSDSPEFYNAIADAVKYLAVFDSINQNSFAGISSHGAIYLNCEGEEQNEIFFIDDISHQAGHVLFNSLTLDTQEYFKEAKETLLKNKLIGEEETRSIYDAFHGLFTYTCILHSLNQCFKKCTFSEADKKVELLSRIAFNAGKLHLDLNNLYQQDVFTKKGHEMFQQFVEGYKYISREYGSTVKDFKFSNQGYTFNFGKFLDLNHHWSTITN